MDLVNEALYGLISLEFHSWTECEHFVELHQKWTEVMPDQEEINKLDIINHNQLYGQWARSFQVLLFAPTM